MNKQLWIITTFFVLIVSTAFGQTYEPLDLAKKIFGKDKFSDIDKYVSGEYKGRPNGQDLPKSSFISYSLLGQSEKKAVVAMTILDSMGKGIDTYLHFEKDTLWKLRAFRALALTGIIEQVKLELEKLTPKQVDDIIEKSKNKKNGKLNGMFTSQEEYNFQLGNTTLTLELDEKIIKHFRTNQKEFERIKDIALKELETKKTDEERSDKLAVKFKPDYQKLFISSVSFGGHKLGNCIDFLIGGMVDNSVGYFYFQDKKDLPEMSSNRMIMIKEIGNGWYIYKTT